MGGRAYPVRHYPIAIRLRDRKGHAILCLALFPQSGDSSGARLEVPFKALLHPESYVRKMLNILQFASNIFNCAGCALALSDTVVTNKKGCTFEGTDLVRLAHEPTSKVRSQNAEHTTVREQYFLKIRLHLLHPISNTSPSSELEWGVGDRMQIDKIYPIFKKYCSLYLRMCIFCCTFAKN